MLTLDAPLIQTLPTGAGPRDVLIAPLNRDPWSDLVVLGADGELTVALNAGDGTWSSVDTSDLGLGPLRGMAVARFDGDVVPDLAVQGPDGIFILGGDGNGGFSRVQTIAADVPGAWAPAGDESVGLAASLVDGDWDVDLVAPSPGTGEVLVLLGRGEGTFAAPVGYSTGASEPVVVAVGQLIGDPFPDLAVGHIGGSVALLEGRGDGTFVSRPDLLVTGLGRIADLSAADVDADGDTDLIVSGTDRVTLLINADDPLASSPIVNGDFSLGLTGWQIEALGHRDSAGAGRVNALGGFAQFAENESFLVSVSQTFTVPPSPQTISFDLTSLGLEDPAGGIPDAFEVSLLDQDLHSLVPTIAPEATSFYNANPNGRISLASGVSVNGNNVTVDISGVAAGTRATIYFDLVGNPPGAGSVAAVDNVRIVPDAVYAETFTATPLPGPFAGSAGVAVDDVDGDGRADIVVADSVLGRLLVFNGDGSGPYARSEFDVSGFGSSPRAVATGTLTAGDRIADVALTLFGSALALTPLRADAVGPGVMFVEPAPGSLVRADVTHVRLHFSEPVLDAGPSGRHSVVNPAAYQFLNAGPNGLFEDGLGDDLVVPIASVAYDPDTWDAVATVAAAGLPLVDGLYRFVVQGQDPNFAIHDLAGNPVGGGAGAVLSFTLNTPPVLVSATNPAGREGEPAELTATFIDRGFLDSHTAMIDWGDGAVTAARVTETDGSGTIAGTHVYADNGQYAVQVTLTDAADGTDTLPARATIDNVAPVVLDAEELAGHEGQSLAWTASFRDAGVRDSHTAVVFWGDGSSTTADVVQADGRGLVTAVHVYADNGLYWVRAEVTDDGGLVGTVEVSAEILNARPALTPAADQTVWEGQTLQLAVATFADPGFSSAAARTEETFTATIDWGDQTAPESGKIEVVPGQPGVPTRGAVSGSHAYRNEGRYTVTVTVADDDSGTASTAFRVSVENAASQIFNLACLGGDEGQGLDFSAAFSDPGSADTHTAVVDWGDGSTSEAEVTESGGRGTIAARHAYADNGFYTIRVAVVDNAGATGTAESQAAIANAAPTLLVLGQPQVRAGQAFTLPAATFTDPGFTNAGAGTMETFAATIDWGDGGGPKPATVEVTQGSPGVLTAGTITASHTYADAGRFTVTVTVADDDLGTATASFLLAPTAKFVVVDQSAHQAFRYRGDLGLLGHSELVHSSPRGVALDLSGQTMWVVDSGKRVDVYRTDGGHLGTWQASDAKQPQDIATDGTHIWIVDDAKDRVYFYRNGASLRSGQPSADAAFNLASANKNPSGLTTDGTTLWVTDEKKNTPRVFVYRPDGTSLGSWNLDPANNDPSGIALDPASGDLWVVDRHDAVAYLYARAAARRGGSLTATASFALDPANHNPEGIADPAFHINVGDVVADAISTPGEIDQWVFNATAGQSIFIDFQALSGGTTTIRLWKPNGALLLSDAASTDAGLDNGPLQLADAGAYTLEVTAAGTRTYRFQLWDVPPPDVATIQVGDVVSGAIETPGAMDQWVFPAVAGQSILVDFTSLSGGTLISQLIAPDASVVYTHTGASRNNHDQGPLTLTQTGNYTLRLSGSGSATGTYAFQIVGISAPETFAYTLGTVIDATIPAPGGVHNYTFPGNSAQEVFLDWRSLSGAATARLRSPAGTVIASGSGLSPANLDLKWITLPADGTYTLEVTNGASSALSYSFVLAGVPGTRVFSTAIDQVISGTLESIGSRDHWLFHAAAGQSYYFDMQEIDGGWLRAKLIAPDETVVFNRWDFVESNHDLGPSVFAQTGQYRLELSDDSGGVPTYQMRFWSVPDPAVRTLQLSAVTLGSIETPGRSDRFTFDGTAGQQLYLDMQEIRSAISGTQTLVTQLIGPSGSVLFTKSGFLEDSHDTGPYTLPADGVYTLRFSGLKDNTTNYQFRVDDVTPEPARPIALGEVVTGAVDVGGRTRGYTFDGTAGQPLTLDVIFNQGFAPLSPSSLGFTVTAPSGAAIASNVTGDTLLSLAQSGTYTIVVDDRNASHTGDDTGRYSFRITADAAQSLPPAANLTVSGVSATRTTTGDPGQITVTWTVTNTGTGSAADWVDRILLSADEIAGGLSMRAVADVARPISLAAGESYQHWATIALPAGLDGEFWVYVDADPLNHVFEDQAEYGNTARADQPSYVHANPRAPGGAPALALRPADGSHYPAGSTLALSGTAAAVKQSIDAIFVIDVSTSTLDPSGLDANFDGLIDDRDDVNGYPNTGDVLDAEIAATLRLIQQLATLTDDLQVATILFAGDSEPLDAGPEAFNQVFVDPHNASYEGDRNTLPNHELALRSLWALNTGFSSSQGARYFRDMEVAAGTRFAPPIRDVARLLQSAQGADRTLVYLLTDGLASDPAAVDVGGVADAGVEFYAFQTGGASVTQQLSDLTASIDRDPASTGTAIAVADPEDLTPQLLATLAAAGVTVNGVPVAALDPAGNFFTPVTLAPGANTFTVTAASVTGRQATQTLTLYGDAPGPVTSTSNLVPGERGLTARFAGTTFNRATSQLHVELQADNGSTAAIAGPLVAVADRFEPAPAVRVSNPETTLDDGRAAWLLDTELPGGGLAPSAASDPIGVALENPLRDRFQPRITFLGPAPAAPAFASIPPRTAPVDALYRYPASVLDADGDQPRYALLQAPAGMTVDAASGEISWTPADADVGYHAVRVHADDGRGGTAEQQYTLLVPSPLPNNPPLILTQPPATPATIGEPYTYVIAAVDPDGDPVALSLGPGTPGSVQLAAGTLRWTPAAADAGSQILTVIVTDLAGAAGSQSFAVRVLGPNTPPQFVSLPETLATAGTAYNYRARAVDSDDAVTYSLVAGPAGMKIDGRSGMITWRTAAADVGDHPILVRATDERGLFADQPYTLSVVPDEQPPAVSVSITGSLVNPGETVMIQVFASDGAGLAAVALEIAGQPVPLDADNSAQYTATASGLIDVLGIATDTSGNVGTATGQLRVFDPADTDPPLVRITSPAFGATVTYLTDIMGTATDPNLEFYRLQYALAGTDQWVTFHESTAAVTDGVLGTFDPTLLANDIYDLRVMAQDVNGQIWYEPLEVNVAGNAKLGNFRLEFTDLNVPLAGIPITIGRIYDTLEAGQSGDFGFGWQLAVAHPRIRETVRVNPLEVQGVPALFGGAYPFRQNTRVYLTNPAGVRVGFTFAPEPEPGLLGAIWRPRFAADPGVYDRLEVADTPLTQNPDGTFALYLFGFPYNPREYLLTAKDGTAYRYDQFDGLRDITDRNQNVLTFSDAGIFSSTGQSIAWTRDAQGRITQIIDPNGNTIHYAYDDAGDLIGVTDQTDDEYIFTYGADPPHYLDTSSCPLGLCVARTEYDEQGRVVSITDALGNPVTKLYDVQSNTEVVGDRLGNETTLVYDDRGNVVSLTDPEGNTTTYGYDQNDNPVTIVDPRGYRTTREYDDRGNLSAITDALDGTWNWTYTAGNNIATETDPLGRVTQFCYDQAGNLSEVIDAAGLHATYQHDGLGRATSLTDVNGNTTQFMYEDSSTSQPNRVLFDDGSSILTEYDSFGQPTRTVNGRGYELLFQYDAAGRFVGMEDAQENTITVLYEAQRPVRVIDPAGRETEYQYTDTGQLARIIDPLGGVLEYAYDANGQTLSQTDPRGNTYSYEYRADGRLAAETDPAGAVTQYEYDAAGNRTAVIDANGNRWEYSYDALNRMIEATDPLDNIQRYAWDAVGNLIAWRDETVQTTAYEYDSLNRLTRTIDPLGGELTGSYDGRGNPLSVTDQNGYTTHFVYDARDRLVQRTDPLGKAANWEYDEVGNLLAWTDENGQAAVYVYDSLNRLIEQSDASGNTQSFSYDAIGNLIKSTDENGNITTYENDALDRQTRVVDALDGATDYAYDAAGNLVSARDARGQTTSYTYDERNDLRNITDALGGLTEFTYDAVGNLTAWTDQNGNTTSYGVDPINRLISVTDALQGVTEFTYDRVGNRTSATGPNGHTAIYSYDPLNRLIRQTDPLGGTESLAYDAVGNLTSWTDANGHATSYTYDPLNRLIAIRDPLDGVTTFGYDAVGNQTSLTDANAHATIYSYDGLNRLIVRTDALDGTRVHQYDPAGNLTSSTDENGHTTGFTYDALNRLITRTDALGGRTTYGYDSVGNLLSRTDPNNHTWSFVYDQTDRTVERIDPLGGSIVLEYDPVGNLLGRTDQNGRQTTYQYDALDRLTLQTDAMGGTASYGYDAASNLISTEDANGHVRSYAYDALHRLVGSTNPLGDQRQYEYDGVGNRTAMVDELGYRTTYTYDALDRLAAIDDAVGQVAAFAFDAVGNRISSSDGLGRTTTYVFDELNRVVSAADPRDALTSYAYDGSGNRTSLTDPLGNITSYVYDDLDRLVRETDPLGHARSFSYDAVGNMIESTDRNGRVRQFQYDALDRQTAELWLDDGTPLRTINFTHDAVGNLTAASDPDSSYAFTYDLLDRVTSVDNAGTPDMPHVVLTYVYDPVGNESSVYDNLGVSVTSAYDAQDQPISRSCDGPGVDPARVEFQYDARGQRSAVQRFADAQGTAPIGRSEFEYDARGRLTGLTHRDAVDAVLADYDYAFDFADQLVSETHHGATSTYLHDDAGQLTEADHDQQADETYAYDANGNRLGGGQAIGPNNQVLADDAYDYQYDGEGNLIQKTERATGTVSEYSYDHRNRLVQVTSRSAGGILLSELEYVYDVFDRRTGKIVDADGEGPGLAEETRLVYDGANVWADFDGAGNILARYLHGNRIDELIARYRPGEGTAWYLGDHLGTIRDLAGAAGQWIDHIDYDSFGNVIAETHPAAGDRFKFTGREWDAELSLYYYRARFYDPRLGRFLSPDPIGFAAGDPNLYRYVGNAPLTFVDPWGSIALVERGILGLFGPRIGSAARGAVFGFACGFAEGFTDVAVRGGGAWAALAEGNRRGAEFAAVGFLLGYYLHEKQMAQLFVWGVFAGVATALALQDPWQVTIIRAGCLYLARPAKLSGPGGSRPGAPKPGEPGGPRPAGPEPDSGPGPRPSPKPRPAPSPKPGSEPIAPKPGEPTAPKPGELGAPKPGVPKGMPGELPQGAQVIRTGDSWYVIEHANGTRTVRFEASEARSPNTARRGGRSRTEETEAYITPDNRVYVKEGQHRLNAVALEGETVPDSVPGADGWLEYTYIGDTTLTGEPPAYNPMPPDPIPPKNPNNPWEGLEGYD